MAADPTLAVFIGSLMLVGAAVGSYWGINRARAPFAAPESAEIVDRRQRFKADHLGHAKMAVVVAGLFSLAALGVMIGAHMS